MSDFIPNEPMVVIPPRMDCRASNNLMAPWDKAARRKKQNEVNNALGVSALEQLAMHQNSTGGMAAIANRCGQGGSWFGNQSVNQYLRGGL